MNLSIVIVTRGEFPQFIRAARDLADRCGGELVLGLDGPAQQMTELRDLADACADVDCQGFVETVLDGVLCMAGGDYVLRLDDDEQVSEPMAEWLAAREYLGREVWSFPRANLYPDRWHRINERRLWPDLQTRLTVRSKARWGTMIHQGCPFGPGHTAPVAIEHHKYLLRTPEERAAIADRYEANGARPEMRVYSLPDHLEVTDYGS